MGSISDKHTREYFEQQAAHLASLCDVRKESIERDRRKRIKREREQYLDDLSTPTPITHVQVKSPSSIPEPTMEEVEIWLKTRREKDPEKFAALDKKRQEAKDKIIERSSVYYEQNKDNIKAYQKAYRVENKDHTDRIRRIYGRCNKARIQASALRRYTSKLQRTPKWYSSEHHTQIVAIIDKRVRLDEDTKTIHHVDHEIPLQGKLVSGLHIPDNLRIMDGSENMSKSNAWNPMNEIIMHKNDDGTYTQEVVLCH